MNYNKKILEAIQKGINLAVDDFDELEPIEVQKKSRIKDDIHAKDLLSFVDLGLPSRTLWAKYNIGVDPDKLDTYQDWYGNYYSWAEIKPKIYYGWNNYKYCNGLFSELTKYSDKKYWDGKNAEPDNKLQIEKEDDIVYLTYGGNWRIPTSKQVDELLSETKYKWVTNYNGIENLNGMLFTGKNRQKLFIPAAGYMLEGENHLFHGQEGNLWTSNLDPECNSRAKYLVILQRKAEVTTCGRQYGFPVRGVLSKQ